MNTNGNAAIKIVKGAKAQKVADGDRYFHMTRRFPVLLAVNLVFSQLIGKLSQDLWMFGVVFFVFVGLIILGDYFSWNNRLNTLLKSGKVTEDEAREIMKSSESGSIRGRELSRATLSLIHQSRR
jgi:hypothetical protein